MVPFWYPQAIVINLPFSLPGVGDVLEFHVFGILVGIAVLFGSWLAQWRAEKLKLNPKIIADFSLWVVLVGFFFAHQFSLFFYFPERVFGEPCTGQEQCLIEGVQYYCQTNGRCDNGDWMEVLRIWSGISSFGGFIGAFIGVVTYFSLRRIVIIPGLFELQGGKNRPILRYVDAVGFAFAFAWIFGRMGCFTAHDHVGIVSDSFLAVNFPDGWRSGVPADPSVGAEGFTPRHDLGFLEMLWAIALSGFFWAFRNKDVRPGFFTAIMMIAYAPFRFYLDTLRAVDIGGADKRYLADVLSPGLTAGQFAAFAVFAGGIWVWWLGGKRMNDPKYMKPDNYDVEIDGDASKDSGATESGASESGAEESDAEDTEK